MIELAKSQTEDHHHADLAFLLDPSVSSGKSITIGCLVTKKRVFDSEYNSYVCLRRNPFFA